MAKFLTELDTLLREDSDSIYVLEEDMLYHSDIAGNIKVPAGFQTDLASVPRIPQLYSVWGNRAHREATLHDYLYCIDCIPSVDKSTADKVFFESMTARNKQWWIKYPMFWGVCLFGKKFFHRRKVADPL